MVHKITFSWHLFVCFLLFSFHLLPAQEIPFFDVEVGRVAQNHRHSSGGGYELANLTSPSLSNRTPVGDYLIASEEVQGNASVLEGEGIPIGFDFPFAGDTFDVFGVSGKGYIVLGKRSEGLTIYADTLRYEENDTVFTRQNPYLISGLMLGKNTETVYNFRSAYNNWGFPGDRNISIYISYTLRLPALNGLSGSFLWDSMISLYEDGRIVKTYTSNVMDGVEFETLAFVLDRFGDDKGLGIYAQEGGSWDNPEVFYGLDNRFGYFSESFRPEIVRDFPGSIYTPFDRPYSCPQPFHWEMGTREGSYHAYFDNDYSLLDERRANTTSSLWWYSPGIHNASYDVYLGTDPHDMWEAGSELPGDSVDIRAGHSAVPLAEFPFSGLAPDMKYYMEVIGATETDTLTCSYEFRTKTEEFNDRYCRYSNPHGWAQTLMYKVDFNDLEFENPLEPGLFNTSRLVPDTGNWTTELARGETYTLSIGATEQAGRHDMRVFIDYDQDGVFDEEREAYLTTSNSSTSYEDIEITIPEGALLGRTRMRVASRQWPSYVFPCGDSYLDFTVTIVPQEHCRSLSYNGEVLETCFREADGAFSVSPEGGTPPYSIQWDTGNPEDTGAELSGLGVNAHHRATIEDAEGCHIRTSMLVMRQTQPVLADTNGLYEHRQASLSGGVPPFSIELSGEGETYFFEGVSDLLDLEGLAPGTYDLEVHDSQGCTYTVEGVEVPVLLSTATGSETLADVLVYPNPARDILYVQGVSHHAVAEVYSMKGVLVKEEKLSGNSIGLTGIPSGLYILRLKDGDIMFNQKVLVH
ncbi:GEVED domain-containing protein [Cytophagaceae bacterium ABcell3]|nr:GEVED domain-containing protein [Cytophagaceae bacterium ABcell3]